MNFRNNHEVVTLNITLGERYIRTCQRAEQLPFKVSKISEKSEFFGPKQGNNWAKPEFFGQRQGIVRARFKENTFFLRSLCFGDENREIRDRF